MEPEDIGMEIVKRLDRAVFLLLERTVTASQTRGSYSFGATRRIEEIDQELTRIYREIRGQEVFPFDD